MELIGKRKLKVILILSVFTFIAFLPLKLESASPDTSDLCLDCHDLKETLMSTEHMIGRVSSNNHTINCQNCHQNYTEHIEDPSTSNIDNPINMESGDVDKICQSCHTGHDSQSDFGYSTHSALELSCVNCHSIHSDPNLKSINGGSDICLKCHKNLLTDFSSRSKHPFQEGNIECNDCHTEYSKEYLDQSYSGNISCKKCHLKQSNPHLYEHEAVNDYSVEGDGCVSCHSAHGSENEYLLHQPKSIICQQCHMPAGHVTAHSGAYASDDCLLCHSDIHGSNNNRYFLDRSLPTTFGGNCYQTGCHQFIE